MKVKVTLRRTSRDTLEEEEFAYLMDGGIEDAFSVIVNFVQEFDMRSWTRWRVVSVDIFENGGEEE